MTSVTKDIVVLVPDKNMEAAISGLLSRHQALNISHVTFDIYVHPERDPGCLRECHNFLRPFAQRYKHALVLLDHQGCGQERKTPRVLQEEIVGRLRQSGWEDRGNACVLSPELEVWVWSQSSEVDVCLGWGAQVTQPRLHEWMIEHNLWKRGESKPDDPKAALEKILYTIRKPRSSSLYRQLAERVGLNHCTDPAFSHFKSILVSWFGVNH